MFQKCLEILEKNDKHIPASMIWPWPVLVKRKYVFSRANLLLWSFYWVNLMLPVLYRQTSCRLYGSCSIFRMVFLYAHRAYYVMALSVCPSVCLSVRPSVRPSVRRHSEWCFYKPIGPIMLWRCLSVCLSVCLFVHPSVRLSEDSSFPRDNSKISTSINCIPGIYLSHVPLRNPIDFGVVTSIF